MDGAPAESMTPRESAAVLQRLAHRAWWIERIRLAALVAALVMPLTLGLGWLAPISPGSQGLVGLILWAGGLGALLFLSKGRRIDAESIAGHLDRTTPALEESTALLLKPPEALPLLARMQQRRVLNAFLHLPRPIQVPVKRLPQATALVGLSLVLSLSAVIWLSPAPVEHRAAPVPLHAVDPDASVGAFPIRVEQARVTVTPPAYTGLPAAASSDLRVEALQQGQVSWVFTFNQPVARALLVFSDGDTLALKARGATSYHADRVVRYSGFYFLESTTATHQRYRSDYYALTVIEDQPPVFTVIRPDVRTIIEPGEPNEVPLHVVADDDYGLGDVRLVATVSKGTGENVKFREQALAFETVTRETSTSWTLKHPIDLAALGMEQGDELFFFVEGWDRRAPARNRGRSETFFVVLRDTSQWADAPSLGLMLSPTETYLRSQRQIILDTEALLAEKANLPRGTFNQRSNNIGIDQKLLRLRYGQFLGEEFVSTVTEAEAQAHLAEEHDEPDQTLPLETSLDAAADTIEQYAHAHDTEEGATFYSEAIKRELKAALAEMWAAELPLRTYRPDEALPYEYRALRMLKALQQKARIYVKRIGFEPPPLEPDEKRLTGDLDEIQSPRAQRTARREEVFPAIRRALPLVQATAPAGMDEEAVALLEAAGHELAGVAIEEAGRYLAALQDLRTLIEKLRAGQPWCIACADAVRGAFWTVLPPIDALPAPREEATTSLSRRYFNELGR